MVIILPGSLLDIFYPQSLEASRWYALVGVVSHQLWYLMYVFQFRGMLFFFKQISPIFFLPFFSETFAGYKLNFLY